MHVWAIADLHLAFGVPEKNMDVFGPEWTGYAEKIEKNWREAIRADDLVLIAGDISWAMHMEQALVDLEWIDQLPGTKVLIKGNHDYWWSSLSKIKKVMPPSIHVIQNSAFNYADVSIGGARLWDTDAYNFNTFIQMRENPKEKAQSEERDQQKIFARELERLELSLKELNQNAAVCIAMTHYPPIGADLAPSQAAALLEKYGVKICVFGHLHNVKKDAQLFGKKGNISYYLTSCDYLDFKPLKIYSSAK